VWRDNINPASSDASIAIERVAVDGARSQLTARGN